MGAIQDEIEKEAQQEREAARRAAFPPVKTYSECSHEIMRMIAKAVDRWGVMNSAHEGYGVLLEEVDELKAHVWMKQPGRDLEAMRQEALDVAAVAIRFAVECCTEEVGRK